MKVEVVTPEDYMGDVIGDLNSRRGQIQGSEPRGNAVAINAFVPLATCSVTFRTFCAHVARACPVHDASSTTMTKCRKNITEEIQAKSHRFLIHPDRRSGLLKLD